MWHTHLIIVGILSVQFILPLSCSDASSPKSDVPDEITITEKDNESKVKITSGGILILKLKANLTTGYAWHIVRNNPNLLELLGEPDVEPIAEDTKKEKIPLVGEPQYLVFRFRAQSSGTNTLELHYFRIFEKKKIKPSKTFKITVLLH
jgi:predicted secreted protein